MNTTTVQLVARTATPYGLAGVHTSPGLVTLRFGSDITGMGFCADLSPDCARELAAALLAHAEAAQVEGVAA